MGVLWICLLQLCLLHVNTKHRSYVIRQDIDISTSSGTVSVPVPYYDHTLDIASIEDLDLSDYLREETQQT